MSTENANAQERTANGRPIAGELALEHCEVFPRIVAYDEWSETVGVVQSSIERAIEPEVTDA